MEKNEQQAQDVLRDEILADAKRQAERVLKQARKEAGEIAEAAATELSAWSSRQLNTARAEAKHRADMILAGLPVETGRLRANRIESLLQSIHDEARQQLVSRDGLDQRQMLVNLCAEAIRKMSGNRFSISLPEADRRLLGDREVEAIRLAAGRPDLVLEIIGDPESRDAGPVVRGNDGKELCDNRLTERLERLWPELRLKIAAYTALIEPLKSKEGDTR